MSIFKKKKGFLFTIKSKRRFKKYIILKLIEAMKKNQEEYGEKEFRRLNEISSNLPKKK